MDWIADIPKVAHDFVLFVSALGQNAWALGTGGVVSVGAVAVKRYWKRNLPWPWVFAAGVLALLLVGSFVAWREQYHESQDQRARADGAERAEADAEKATLEVEKQRDAANTQRDAKQTENDFLRNQVLKRLVQQPPPQRVQVTVPQPPAPKPVVFKRIMITKQEPSDPTEADSPFATTLVVATTAEISPTSLVLKCNASVMHASARINQSGLGHMLTNPEFRRSRDGKTLWYSFAAPAFSPETPLVFTLSGKSRIVVESADEQQAPADAEPMGPRAVLEIGM
jgi:hypothetical protein